MKLVETCFGVGVTFGVVSCVFVNVSIVLKIVEKRFLLFFPTKSKPEA